MQREAFTIYSKALDTFLPHLVRQGCLRSEASIGFGSNVECIATLHLNMATLGFKAEFERGKDFHQLFSTKSYFLLLKIYSTVYII